MAQQRPEEREVTNGLAKDMNLKKAETMLGRNPELQGYLLIGAGAVLALFSLGFLPIFKWVLFAVGAGLLAWGMQKTHLIERISEFVKHMRSK